MSFVAPPVTERRMAVRLTTAAERQVRLRHPWVFNKSVESTSHDGAPGDLAVIFDKKRAFVGIGLWDPASPIRIRMVHVGKPRTIDADFWRERVLEALTRRDALITDPATTAYRVIHGENDGFSGLVCDLYDTTLVVKLYSAVWLPHLQSIVEALADLLDVESAVVRLGRLAASQDLQGLESGMALVGKAPTAPVAFLENGLEFHADVIEGQKTGHFLDQRDNRAMVRALTEGAKVLDVFSCTGGFSVHAAAGGARSVTSIDVSPGALAAAQANMAANNDIAAVAACRHQVLRGDAFDLMESAIRQGERYDFVIIDPPSFAARRIQIGPALHSYNRLTTLGLALCADEGTLVQASCSSRVTTEDFLAIVHGAAAEVDIALDDAVVTGHGADHPIGFAEGSYLKAIFATPRSVSSF